MKTSEQLRAWVYGRSEARSRSREILNNLRSETFRAWFNTNSQGEIDLVRALRGRPLTLSESESCLRKSQKLALKMLDTIKKP